MDRFKQFLVEHFEKFLVLFILLAAATGTFLMQNKDILLFFYYVPVVFAGYFLGRRPGVLSALLSILTVTIFAIIFPAQFFPREEIVSRVLLLSSWGGFLILTAYAVGSLYEQEKRQMEELRMAYIGILEILAKYIETKDGYTKGHSIRVSNLAKQIAIALELPRHEVENVRVAGLLHDIGKIEISSEVIRKAAQLTPEEREHIDSHSERGAVILAKVGEVLSEVVPIVISHHRFFEETLDEAAAHHTSVPLGARIIAVADAFDAMTTDRPYRKGKTPWEATQELKEQAGRQFDPEVVEAFRRVIGSQIETT